MPGALPADNRAGNKPDNHADSSPIFDTHLHYNADLWEAISPDDAIARLRALGVWRAG